LARHRDAIVIQSCNSGPVLGREWRALAPSLSEALAEGIRNAVLDGRIHPADRLPAERNLPLQLGVSRGTLVPPYARLRPARRPRRPGALGCGASPFPVDGPGGLRDRRPAGPAAPLDAYTEAIRAALANAPRLLLEDGEPGPGLAELRALIAGRYTGQGLPTR